MLNAAAGSLASTLPDGERHDLYPDHPDLRAEIDELNALNYTDINNGAYKAGFSSDQSVYAVAFEAYFEALDQLDDWLSDGRPFPDRANLHRSRPAPLPDALSARPGLLRPDEAERCAHSGRPSSVALALPGPCLARRGGQRLADRLPAGYLGAHGTTLSLWGCLRRCTTPRPTSTRNSPGRLPPFRASTFARRRFRYPERRHFRASC